MTVTCLRCHRVLKDPVWAGRRMGRVCAEKLGLVARRPAAASVAVKAAPKAEPGDGQQVLFELEDEIEEEGA